MKEETKEHLFTIIGSIIIGLIVVLITICLGCSEQLVKPEAVQVYDPNAPQYAFLEVAEPNWVAAYGDTLETRMVYNISKNRVMNAIVSKRLLALENPVETEQSAEEALEEAITPCEEPKKEVVDPNEVKE